MTTKIRTVREGHLTFYYGIAQGTQEWLELRVKYATCSNADILCDKGIKAALECNRQHAARRTPNASEYTERGHVLEAEIKQLLEEHFNNDTQALVDDCTFITNDLYPLGGYSPDGIIVDLETQKFVAPVEVKCFNDWTWRQVPMSSRKVKHYSWKHKLCCEDVKNLPLKYRLQCEMEMLMTDTYQLVLVLYNPDAEGDVPKLKIHLYTPFTEIKDGKPVMTWREKIASLLRGDKKQPRAIDEALKRWGENAKMDGIKW